jgi:hypothetical protein
LKFVIFPVQILFKSCKTLPVRLVRAVSGRRNSFQRVELLLIGILLVIGNSENAFLGNEVYFFIPKGFIILSLSLGFDAVYFIREGKIYDATHIESYDIMFKVQSRKALQLYIRMGFPCSF